MSPGLRAAREAFRLAERQVEEARATLLLGVPSGRAPRLPLAQALAGFERALDQAASVLDRVAGWEGEPEWEACRRALEEAGRRAERLRLRPPPQGYEELAPILSEIIEPLEAFGEAGRPLPQPGP